MMGHGIRSGMIDMTYIPWLKSFLRLPIRAFQPFRSIILLLIEQTCCAQVIMPCDAESTLESLLATIDIRYIRDSKTQPR